MELSGAAVATSGKATGFVRFNWGGARVRGGEGGGGSEGARGARNRERIEQGRRISAGESEWRELGRALLRRKKGPSEEAKMDLDAGARIRLWCTTRRRWHGCLGWPARGHGVDHGVSRSEQGRRWSKGIPINNSKFQSPVRKLTFSPSSWPQMENF